MQKKQTRKNMLVLSLLACVHVTKNTAVAMIHR